MSYLSACYISINVPTFLSVFSSRFKELFRPDNRFFFSEYMSATSTPPPPLSSLDLLYDLEIRLESYSSRLNFMLHFNQLKSNVDVMDFFSAHFYHDENDAYLSSFIKLSSQLIASRITVRIYIF